MSVGLDHRLGRVDSLSDLSIVGLSCMVNNHHGTAKYDDPLKQTRNSLQSVNHYATNNA
jgi:hypothetical protein